MNQIDATTIYLFALFILPGFLAYTVSGALFKQARDIKEIEVTYKSLLYSCSMYAVLYIVSKGINVPIVVFAQEYPVASIIIMVILSIIWGVSVYLITAYDLLFKALEFLGFEGRARPANLYQLLLDPKYQPKAADGYWLVYKADGVTRQGYVTYTDLAGNNRMVYLTGVQDFDEEGNLIHEYPENYGIFLDVTKIEGYQIKYCNE